MACHGQQISLRHANKNSDQPGIGDPELASSLARLLSDPSDHPMYSSHVKFVSIPSDANERIEASDAVTSQGCHLAPLSILQREPMDRSTLTYVALAFQIVNKMSIQEPLQPLVSQPMQVLVYVIERSGANEDKKKQVLSILTQGWLEKILEHAGVVMEVAGLDTTQAAMTLKHLSTNVASALEADEPAVVTNGTNAIETAVANEAEQESEAENVDGDDSSSASDGDSDDRRSLAPRGTLRRLPVAAQALVPYDLQVKRYKGSGKYTLLLRVGTAQRDGVKASKFKKPDIKSSIINMARKSRHPNQAWSLHPY